MATHIEDLIGTLLDAAPGGVRCAGPDDTVGGVVPRWVASPKDAAEVAALMRVATEHGLAVVPCGSGTRLSWGPPPERVDLVLDATGLAGVVEHVAGDLVVAVRAGTRLVELQERLAHSGQRLAIDGEHGDATVGGMVAHAVSGPSRLLYGTLRDLLIGATFVRADGVVAKAGGKVVKNVAGYDLSKLLHGSWGTLAVLTEAVFRLHPVPPAQRWVSVPAGRPARTGELTQRVLRAQLVPAALELDRGPGQPATLTVLVEGTGIAIDGRARAVCALLGDDAVTSDTPPPWWGHRPAADGEVLLRLTTELAALDRLLTAIDGAVTAAGLAVQVRGSAGVGSLLAGLPGESDPTAVGELVAQLRAGASAWGGTVVVLDGPPSLTRTVDTWGPVPGLELMRRVKDRFDPRHLLSPGRFVGGI